MKNEGSTLCKVPAPTSLSKSSSTPGVAIIFQLTRISNEQHSLETNNINNITS